MHLNSRNLSREIWGLAMLWRGFRSGCSPELSEILCLFLAQEEDYYRCRHYQNDIGMHPSQVGDTVLTMCRPLNLAATVVY